MHCRRLLTAAVLLPPAYLYITRLPAPFFSAFLILAGSAAAWEFSSMYGQKALARAAAAASAFVLLFASAYSGRLLAWLFVVLVIAAVTARLVLKRTPAGALRDLAPLLIGTLYIPALLSYQIFLRARGAYWIIFLYASVWAGDSAALYAGSFLGRHKLCPEISPAKTVEGAIGSLLGGVAGALVVKALLMPGLCPWNAAALGFVLGAVSILGDLVESMFKRDAGVKDSSRLIPGHGGILDKLDSPLIAGPVLFWLLGLSGILQK